MGLELRAIDDETARQLLAGLTGLDWSWHPDELPDVFARFGWTIVYTSEDGGRIGSTSWPFGSDAVHVLTERGAVTSIEVTVSDRHRKRLPESLVFMRETFLRLVGVAQGLFGAPAT